MSYWDSLQDRVSGSQDSLDQSCDCSSAWAVAGVSVGLAGAGFAYGAYERWRHSREGLNERKKRKEAEEKENEEKRAREKEAELEAERKQMEVETAARREEELRRWREERDQRLLGEDGTRREEVGKEDGRSIAQLSFNSYSDQSYFTTGTIPHGSWI